MRLCWILTAALMLGPISGVLAAEDAIAASAERPVSGHVTAVAPQSGRFSLDATVFHVPSRVYDLRKLSVGTYVVVTFKRSYGRRVATSIEIVGPS